MEEIVAEILLDLKAVHVDLDYPFLLTSGRISPVYVDCRKIISFPDERREIIEFAETVVKKIGEIDVIAGGETAGIPFAAWLSEKMDLPMIYVRKKPKGHGKFAQVEGEVREGDRVLLFEDLIFDGGSKINFSDGIRKTGAKMEHCLVIFEYGSDETRKNLMDHGIELYSLTNWKTLLEVGKKKNYFREEEEREIKKFLKDSGIRV
ncbi:MAG: orotate phosphoribosyltransferase [Candidatus Syntropharchaeia archaeon]